MKNNCILFTIIISIIIIFALYFYLDRPTLKIKNADIKNGYLHIDQYDEVKLHLNGEWEFAKDKLVGPDDDLYVFNDYEKIPYLWHYDGVATYRLILNAEKEYKTLGIKLPFVYSAYNLYLNDELIGYNGVPSYDEKSEVIERKITVIPVHIKEGENEFLIQVSNHRLFRGGISEGIVLMDYRELFAIFNRMVTVDLLFIGIFGFIFVLLMMVFLINPEKAYLYFSIVAIGLCLKTFVTNSILISHIVKDFSWEIGNRIESGFNFVILPVFLLLILEIYIDIFHEDLLKLLTGIIGVNLLLVSCLPHKIYDSFLLVLFLGLNIIAFYMIIKMIKNIKYYYHEVILLLLGAICMAAFSFVDLFNYLLMRPSIYKVHYSAFVVSLFMVVLLLVRVKNKTTINEV